MLKIGLVGHSGRMGQEIKALIEESAELTLAGVWDRQGARLANTDGAWCADEIDAVIDFSLPDNFKDVVKWCHENKVPLVSGVTGLTSSFEKSVLNALGDAQVKTPFFWASNMSLGIASVRQMLRALKVFRKESFNIVETHHVHKKDKPSGTAVTLKQDLETFVDPKQIKVGSIREGEVFGVHEVTVKTPNEEIKIKHTALNRKVFAQGSLEVVNWLKGQPQGFYTMGDFLKDATES